ncbi:MAG: hypothetical protein AAGA56_02850 [Myxococcota bacterium]
MTDMRFNRTHYAQKGYDFATLFRAKFGQLAVGGLTPVLREPAAESTGGGAQAVQHLILRPPDPAQPTLTIGSVNVAPKTAKLRAFDCVDALHQRRFEGRPLPISSADYHGFFDRLAEFMRRQGFALDIETQPPEGVLSVRPGSLGGVGGVPSSTRLVVVMLVGIAVALAALVLYAWLRR